LQRQKKPQPTSKKTQMLAAHGAQNLDDREDIEVVLKSIDEIPGLIKDGVITHSLILAAFYRYYMEYGR